MKMLLAVSLALVSLLVIPCRAGAEQDNQEKVYGAPGVTTICVTVSDDFVERGKHYVPIGSKFSEFIKALHVRTDKKIDVWHGVKVTRHKKNVFSTVSPEGKSGVFQLEDGDLIEIAWINW